MNNDQKHDIISFFAIVAIVVVIYLVLILIFAVLILIFA